MEVSLFPPTSYKCEMQNLHLVGEYWRIYIYTYNRKLHAKFEHVITSWILVFQVKYGFQSEAEIQFILYKEFAGIFPFPISLFQTQASF